MSIVNDKFFISF